MVSDGEDSDTSSMDISLAAPSRNTGANDMEATENLELESNPEAADNPDVPISMEATDNVVVAHEDNVVVAHEDNVADSMQ